MKAPATARTATSAGIKGPPGPSSARSWGSLAGAWPSAGRSPMTRTPSAEMFLAISAPISVARCSAHAGVTIFSSSASGCRIFMCLTAPYRMNLA
jgi:hypothetical protein